MKFEINQKGINRLLQTSEVCLEKAAFRFEGLLRKDIPQDTGDTARSIHTIKLNNNRFMIGSNSWSAYMMEYGRKPGKMPNLDSLVGWTARKIGSSQKTSRYDDLNGKEGKKLKSVVFLIARSISIHGIKERKIFSNAWYKHQASIKNYFYDLMKNS